MFHLVVNGGRCFSLLDEERHIVVAPSLHNDFFLGLQATWSIISYVIRDVCEGQTCTKVSPVHSKYVFPLDKKYEDEHVFVHYLCPGSVVLEYRKKIVALVWEYDAVFTILESGYKVDVLLWDMSVNYDKSWCERLSAYDVRYFLPVGVLVDEQAISLCSMVMLYSKIVPKYFKRWQYLVLES